MLGLPSDQRGRGVHTKVLWAPLVPHDEVLLEEGVVVPLSVGTVVGTEKGVGLGAPLAV